MSKSYSTDIKWNLTCSQTEALKQLGESIDNKFGMGWYKIRGRIEDTYFKIWTKTPGMRGQSIAIGKGQIIKKGEKASQLLASLTVSWPFYYFQFPKNIMIAIVILAVISWCLSLTGAIFSTYEILSNIFFPIGAFSILLVILSVIRHLGESELNDLRKFLEKSFSSYRKLETY